MSGLTIERLRLAPIMERRARELELAFPGLIRWTSGRRTVMEQARAMAVNHLHDPLGYMTRTYLRAHLFLDALSMGPAATHVDAVTAVFYQVMVTNPDAVRSTHFDGHAVDLDPMEERDGNPTPDGQQVILWIKTCPDTVDFRTREGNLRRWHWACRASVPRTSVQA